MKLRQKLAMVLATAMIVTAVPVTTMAASTNSFNKTISIVADKEITTTQGLELVVDYTDKVNVEDVFYLTATDFEFSEEAYGVDGLEIKENGQTIGTVKWNSKTELEVKVEAGHDVDKVNVPVAGTPKKGTPAITIDATGSFATGGTLTLGGEVTTDKTLVATAGDAKNISVEGNGTIGDIIIEEKIAEQLSGQVITVKLPNNSDLVFASSNTAETVTLKGSRGLSTVAEKPAAVEVVDGKEIQITMPEIASTRAGSVAIKGIKVAAENQREDVNTGEVKVTVQAEGMEDTKLVVANIAEYSVTMNVEEVETLTSGQGKETVKVVIEETTAGSLGNKPVYLTIDGAQFEAITAEGEIDFTNDKKEEITIVPVQNATTAQKYEIEIELSAKAAQSGDVVITAEGRGLEEAIELKVAEVKAPITVETETFNIEPGIKDQKGGKIVITETEAGKLGKKEIVIKADDEDLKIKSADVKVTGGDIKVDSEAKDGVLVLTVERTSDEASEITIENIEMTAPKYMAEGGYDFLIGGRGISDKNNTKMFLH